MFGNLAWSFNNEFLHLNQFFDQNFGKIFRTKKFKLFYKIWLIESGLNRYDIIEVSRNFAQAFGNLRTKKIQTFQRDLGMTSRQLAAYVHASLRLGSLETSAEMDVEFVNEAISRLKTPLKNLN